MVFAIVKSEADSITASVTVSCSKADEEVHMQKQKVSSINGSVKSETFTTGSVLGSDATGTEAHVVLDSDGTACSTSASYQPRVYPDYPYPPRVDHQWRTGIAGTAYYPQSSISYHYRQPHQHPFFPPAGLSACSRKLKACSIMDYVPSPESFYAPELAKSTFAASPNSLYMYDQERHDMQNTLNNGILGQPCTGSDMAVSNTEPDFDLNPQYENSNSLEGYFGGTLNDTLMVGTSEGTVNSQPTTCSEKQESDGMLEFLEATRLELKQGGPTLAELNMDPYLFEDIYSVIGEEENVQASRTMEQAVRGVRKQASATRPVKTETSPKMFSSLGQFPTHQPPSGLTPSQTQSPSAASLTNVFGMKSQNVAVVPPFPVTTTTTTIKTEPMDSFDTTSKSCLHKMLSSPPLKPVLSTPGPVQTSSPPRQVMPVVGQSRAPSLAQQPVKSESMEEKWKEIEKFIHDPELSNRKRKRHASGGSAIMSDDEDFRSHMGNMSDDDDSDSDADSDFSDTPLEESLTELAKKSKQYFWQYNVQAKGPKGTRLKLNINDADPHHPSSFEDPVFDVNSTSLVGIRHGGKARKGDGNEVSPNPKKLCQIGQQLYKLSRQINSCQVSNDLPAHIRNKSRKEKNKLASRACRLKKKAQHEANKIKLTGLDSEQNELLEVIHSMWPQLKERAQQHLKGVVPSPGPIQTLSEQLEDIIKSRHKTVVAGNTTDYVNDVVRKVEDGDLTGGLPIKSKVKK